MGGENYWLQYIPWGKEPYICVYVYWFGLRGPWQHDKSHWMGHIHGTVRFAQINVSAKFKYKKFHRGRASWHQRKSVIFVQHEPRVNSVRFIAHMTTLILWTIKWRHSPFQCTLIMHQRRTWSRRLILWCGWEHNFWRRIRTNSTRSIPLLPIT